MIRLHHPLVGKEFIVLKGGAKEILVQLEDGSTMKLPRSWTDADGAQTPLRERQTRFTVESLRRLITLLDALMERC